MVASRRLADIEHGSERAFLYRAAVNQSAFVLTDPYIFFTTNQIPITLAQRTIDGGTARVRSRAGEIEAPVEVTDRVMPGVVSIPPSAISSESAARTVLRWTCRLAAGSPPTHRPALPTP